ELELVERWILTRLDETIHAVDEAAGRYRLNEAAGLIYDFAWGDYCDWYLELIKPAPGEAMGEEALALAVEVYEAILRLLHPFMPFITEALWHRLRPRADGDALIVAAWPAPDDAATDPEAAELFRLLQAMISGIRSVRSQYSVAPSKRIAAAISVSPTGHGEGARELAALVETHRDYVQRLAGVENLWVDVGLEKPPASVAVVVEGQGTEIAQKEGFLRGVEAKLANAQFVSRAPEEVVAKERQKAADARAELEKLRANLADLG